MKLPVILYFIKGPLPSEADVKKASSYDGSAKVVYRNGNHVEDTDSLELCDGVAGAVPARYKEKFPSAEDAVKSFKKEKKDLSDRVGDEEAPAAVTNVVSEPLQAVKESSSNKNTASEWKAGK